MNKIGIGIPIYKDLANLKDLVEEIANCRGLLVDFYILDNGSNDLELTAYLDSITLPNVKTITLKDNLGFGGGVKHILQCIENDFIGWMPGNGKVNPKSLIDIEHSFQGEGNCQAFKANRSKRRTSENFKTLLVGLLISIYFRANLFDSGGTPTIIKRDFVGYFLKGPNDFSFEAFSMLTIRKLNLNLIRTSVPYGSRSHGKSHWQRGFKSEIALLIRILSQKREWMGSLK